MKIRRTKTVKKILKHKNKNKKNDKNCEKSKNKMTKNPQKKTGEK